MVCWLNHALSLESSILNLNHKEYCNIYEISISRLWTLEISKCCTIKFLGIRDKLSFKCWNSLITPSIEGVSNDNAEVINKFTISQNTFEDKFDKLEKDTDEIMETMDKIEGKAKVILFQSTGSLDSNLYISWVA